MMDSTEAPRPQETRFACPCCGYPTLTERAAYDICSLCYWEDDGQDTDHANEFWPGPNHGYSLSEARSNFHTYLSMYPPEEDRRFVGGDNPKTTTIKRSLIATFDKLRQEASPESLSALWQEVERQEQALHDEMMRRVEAGE